MTDVPPSRSTAQVPGARFHPNRSSLNRGVAGLSICSCWHQAHHVSASTAGNMATKPNGEAWSQIAGGPCHDCTGLGLAIDEPLAFVLSGEMAWDMLEGC